MSADGWEVLETRVSRLENQNRWLKAFCVIFCLTVICGCSMGHAKAGTTVEAQTLLLRDKNGDITAEMQTINGEPRLLLTGPNRQREVEISPYGVKFSHDGPALKGPIAQYSDLGVYLSNGDGKPVLEIGGGGRTSDYSTPVPEIKLFDDKGKSIFLAP